MRIGLLRHFPVQLKFPTGWKTAAELQTWRENYDVAETSAIQADLGGIAWQVCISSDLPRACVTAGAVFPGSIERTALLREAEFAQFRTGNLRLPIRVWQWILRITWMTGHSSQRACRDAFRQRVSEVADRISASDRDTLVVSHAGMMAYLGAELRRRGFAGPRLRIADHAKVYLFEKTRPAPASAQNSAGPEVQRVDSSV